MYPEALIDTRQQFELICFDGAMLLESLKLAKQALLREW